MIFCGHAEWYMAFRNLNKILIYALELKLQHFEVFPVHLYREAMHLECFTSTRYVSGRGHAYMFYTNTLREWAWSSYICYALCEWAWSCIHMNMTIFTRVKNCNVLALLCM